jgi:phage portal protein, HK97 family
MTFLQQLLGQSSSFPENEERFWHDAYSLTTNSGSRVSADNALKISAAWACSRLISETVAMLPHIVYKRLNDGGKERATAHPLYGLLHNQPNNLQTSFEFTDMMQMHALLRGSGYAKIIQGPRGPVDRLIPIHPDRVLATEMIDEDKVRYKILEFDGTVNTYLDDEIFRLPGLSLDGINTVSVITYARESMGLSLSAERFAAKLFANFSRPAGFLKHPGHLSPTAQENLRKQSEEMTGGENLHRIGVLEEGMEFQPVTFTPEDSQMLQTREFQAEDVCRWFRVPPHMIGLTSKTTSWGSGISELSQGFVTYVLMPWLVRWQQVISRDLILATDTYFVEFLTDALLRGDIEKRYNAYSVGRNGGWLATNEIRKAENMNPIEGGDDDYLTALNMKRSLDVNAAPDLQKDSAHYQRIVRESAGRVARKELAAMTRAAEKGSGDWETAVNAFYKDHADFVAETMCLPSSIAVAFAESGRVELLQSGPAVLVGWIQRRSNFLVRLSVEEG